MVVCPCDPSSLEMQPGGGPQPLQLCCYHDAGKDSNCDFTLGCFSLGWLYQDEVPLCVEGRVHRTSWVVGRAAGQVQLDTGSSEAQPGPSVCMCHMQVGSTLPPALPCVVVRCRPAAAFTHLLLVPKKDTKPARGHTSVLNFFQARPRTNTQWDMNVKFTSGKEWE
jgi:hypothetical protein